MSLVVCGALCVNYRVVMLWCEPAVLSMIETNKMLRPLVIVVSIFKGQTYKIGLMFLPYTIFQILLDNYHKLPPGICEILY